MYIFKEYQRNTADSSAILSEKNHWDLYQRSFKKQVKESYFEYFLQN